MAASLAILIIHDMGAQQRGYSDGLCRALEKSLGERAMDIVWRDVQRANVLVECGQWLPGARRKACAREVPLQPWHMAPLFEPADVRVQMD